MKPIYILPGVVYEPTSCPLSLIGGLKADHLVVEHGGEDGALPTGGVLFDSGYL